MKLREDFQIVFIRPRNTFDSFSDLRGLVPELAEEVHVPSSYFSLPLLAFILGPDGEPIWTACLFLAEVALQSKSLQGDTVRTYAESLLPWLRFLRDRNIDLDEVTEEEFGIYRAEISHACLANGESYASATINLRVVVPAGMHQWAARRGVLDSPLGSYLLNNALVRHDGYNRGFPSHRGHAKAPFAPRVVRRLPCALSMEELSRVLHLTPMPYRLMMHWCVAASLRRIEVTGLRKAVLPSPEQIGLADGSMVCMSMLRKGSRELPVFAPARLVEQTNWYLLTERPHARDPRNEGLVFLTERGHPVSRQVLSREFRRAADAMGSTATLHHLRHTFAVHTLGLLQKRCEEGEELNPIKILQVLLGHASCLTTEIYTQAIETASPAVMEALDYLFGATER